MAEKRFTNIVNLDGVLVSKDIVEAKDKVNKKDYIRGSITVRTKDGSEHELNFFTFKFKKGTTELSPLYQKIKTIKEDYVSISEDKANPTYLKIKFAKLTGNMFKSKDGDLIVNSRLNIDFTTKIEELNDIEFAQKTCTFNLTGVVVDISDKELKGEPTGDKIVRLNFIRQRSEKSGEEWVYVADKLEEFSVVVPSEYADAVTGYWYPDTVINVQGDVINLVKYKDNPNVIGKYDAKVFDYAIKENRMVGGDQGKSIDEYGITDELYETLKAKKKLEINETLNPETAQKQSKTTITSNNPFEDGGSVLNETDLDDDMPF